MDMVVLSMAALAALAPSSIPLGQAAPTQTVRTAGAQRSPGGAVASATITVRIISGSARIGAGAPPRPAMEPRAATIAAADGSPVAALIYEFE